MIHLKLATFWYIIAAISIFVWIAAGSNVSPFDNISSNMFLILLAVPIISLIMFVIHGFLYDRKWK